VPFLERKARELGKNNEIDEVRPMRAVEGNLGRYPMNSIRHQWEMSKGSKPTDFEPAIAPISLECGLVQ
jgi:hypothetical protein